MSKCKNVILVFLSFSWKGHCGFFKFVFEVLFSFRNFEQLRLQHTRWDTAERWAHKTQMNCVTRQRDVKKTVYFSCFFRHTYSLRVLNRSVLLWQIYQCSHSRTQTSQQVIQSCCFSPLPRRLRYISVINGVAGIRWSSATRKRPPGETMDLVSQRTIAQPLPAGSAASTLFIWTHPARVFYHLAWPDSNANLVKSVLAVSLTNCFSNIPNNAVGWAQPVLWLMALR